MELIDHSARERGRTIVLCTHFLGEAGTSADLMAVMHHGRLAAFGRPEELAAARWPFLDVYLDLGGPPTPEVEATLRGLVTVRAVRPVADGALVSVPGRDAIPSVVADVVASGGRVYGTRSLPKGLEDVYFAVQQEIAA